MLSNQERRSPVTPLVRGHRNAPQPQQQRGHCGKGTAPSRIRLKQPWDPPNFDHGRESTPHHQQTRLSRHLHGEIAKGKRHQVSQVWRVTSAKLPKVSLPPRNPPCEFDDTTCRFNLTTPTGQLSRDCLSTARIRPSYSVRTEFDLSRGQTSFSLSRPAEHAEPPNRREFCLHRIPPPARLRFRNSGFHRQFAGPNLPGSHRPRPAPRLDLPRHRMRHQGRE